MYQVYGFRFPHRVFWLFFRKRDGSGYPFLLCKKDMSGQPGPPRLAMQ